MFCSIVIFVKYLCFRFWFVCFCEKVPRFVKLELTINRIPIWHGLKPPHQKALDALLNGTDCICCLPTGFGKSLIYEILPFVDPNSLVVVVVVVVPLNAIFAQPIQKLGSMAISLSKGKKYIQMKLLMAGLGIYSHTQKIS